MSWASLSNNECVSQANLQDAIANNIFVLKNAFGSTNEQISTSQAENWVYINAISKPANELVVKSDLVASSISANWTWYYNNIVEAPPFGGGYITIDVNGINVVSQSDLSGTQTTYTGNFNVNIGDSVSIYVYTYANNTYGTQTILNVQSPTGTILYNNDDIQINPGSPSSNTYTFTATSSNIVIYAESSSY
jgi:hypothetical protein